MVKGVGPDLVPNCPPERNLFLELEALGLLVGLDSTKSTNLTGSQTPSPQPQRNQPARAARSAPGASQPRDTTKTTLFPYGQRAKSNSTRGSARRETTSNSKETPSPEPLKSTQPAPDTKSKFPESTFNGQVNQQQGDTKEGTGLQTEESDLLQEWGDAFDNGHTKADFDVWAEERKRDIHVGKRAFHHEESRHTSHDEQGQGSQRANS